MCLYNASFFVVFVFLFHSQQPRLALTADRMPAWLAAMLALLAEEEAARHRMHCDYWTSMPFDPPLPLPYGRSEPVEPDVVRRVDLAVRACRAWSWDDADVLRQLRSLAWREWASHWQFHFVVDWPTGIVCRCGKRNRCGCDPVADEAEAGDCGPHIQRGPRPRLMDSL